MFAELFLAILIFIRLLPPFSHTSGFKMLEAFQCLLINLPGYHENASMLSKLSRRPDRPPVPVPLFRCGAEPPALARHPRRQNPTKREKREN